MMKPKNPLSDPLKAVLIYSISLALFVTAAGCGKEEKKTPPPMPVTVAPVESETVPIYLDYVGTTDSIQTVDINARVEGFLIKRAFEDGADVKEGQLLFVIDPRPFEADLAAAQAQLSESRASLSYALEQVRRYEPLVGKQYITQDTYDGYVTQAEENRAAVEAAQANVTQAKLNLGYCTMYSPFDGRIGRRYVDVGNLVGAAGEPTKLATIVQLDPLYVYFSVAERDVPKVIGAQEENPLTVSVLLPDETKTPESGTVDFINNQVDVNTGTIELRAVVTNTRKSILPGQYVKVRLLLGEQPNTTIVPQQAVGEQQGQKYVYVVGEGNKVEFKNVTVGQDYGSKYTVIASGVKAGEKVIIEGLQKVRPGMVVSPKAPRPTPGPTPGPRAPEKEGE
ncbi:MAG: efflux RND transporter periplasmic adaptor subunit [Candidatus Dadabacteria bacterium]|nr:efflux RND transporter periplasmic adaptor subunit [Candidatus Dadabacteria bacterium]